MHTETSPPTWMPVALLVITIFLWVVLGVLVLRHSKPAWEIGGVLACCLIQTWVYFKTDKTDRQQVLGAARWVAFITIALSAMSLLGRS